MKDECLTTRRLLLDASQRADNFISICCMQYCDAGTWFCAYVLQSAAQSATAKCTPGGPFRAQSRSTIAARSSVRQLGSRESNELRLATRCPAVLSGGRTYARERSDEAECVGEDHAARLCARHLVQVEREEEGLGEDPREQVGLVRLGRKLVCLSHVAHLSADGDDHLERAIGSGGLT